MCVWIHLNLIGELRRSTKELFPVADYAFTTIPTYPSGQIGFVVCSLDANRNVREPLRQVPDCRYYNSEVHKASFIVPEFARKVIEEGAPAPGRVIPTGEGNAKAQRAPKKILLLGSGYVAKPFAEYVTRFPSTASPSPRSRSSTRSASSRVSTTPPPPRSTSTTLPHSRR